MRNTISKAAMILFSSALCFSSCKKNETPFYSIDSDMKKVFNYQVGTYWIMKDSATGDLDSMYVYNNIYTPNLPSGSYNHDQIDVYIKLPFLNNGIPDTTNYLFSLSGKGTGLAYNGRITYTPFFEYPLSVGQYTTQIYPVYSVNGNSYNSVSEIHIYGNLAFYGIQYDDWYYFNQTNGYVKIRLNHTGNESLNKVYELVRNKLTLQ